MGTRSLFSTGILPTKFILGSGGGSSPVLRTAANNSYVQSSSIFAGGRDSFGFIQTYTLGSCDWSSLTVNLFNVLASAGVRTPTTTTLIFRAMYIVINGVSKQITYAGNGTITILADEEDVLMDAVVPSDFGLTKFDRGITVSIRGYGYRPNITIPIPVTNTMQNNFVSGQEMYSYDSALGHPTNATATSGSLTQPSWSIVSLSSSGTNATATVTPGNPLPTVGSQVSVAGSSVAGYNQNARTVTANNSGLGTFTYTTTGSGLAPATGGTYATTKSSVTVSYRPILLGLPIGGDPRTEYIGGDSIDVGLSDGTSGAGTGIELGFGRHSRSMHDATVKTNFFAYLNCAFGGSVIDAFNSPNEWGWKYMKYCKYASGSHITNTFGTTNTGVTLAVFLPKMQLWWAELKDAGIEKILVTGAQSRGTFTPLPITSVTVTSNVATAIIPSGNPAPLNGNQITVSGATPSGINGSKTLTSVTGSGPWTVTFAATAVDGAATGTITYNDQLASYEGQAPTPGYYDAGGVVEQYYDAVTTTEIPAGRVEGLVKFDSAKGPAPNNYKWLVNGVNGYASPEQTGGGLHPTPVIHELEAVELRAAKATLFT